MARKGYKINADLFIKSVEAGKINAVEANPTEYPQDPSNLDVIKVGGDYFKVPEGGASLPEDGNNNDVLTKTIVDHTFTPGVTWRFKNSYTQEELEAISGNRIYGPEGYSDYIFTGSGEGPNIVSYAPNFPDYSLTYSIEAGSTWRLNYGEEVEAPTMIVPDWFTEDKFEGADFDLFINTLFVSEGREEKLEWKPGLPEYRNEGEVLTVVTESGSEAEFDKEMSFKDSYSIADWTNILNKYVDLEDLTGYLDLFGNNESDIGVSFVFEEFLILSYWDAGIEYDYIIEEAATEIGFDAGWYQLTDGEISKVETPKITIPSEGTEFIPYADGSTPTISDFTSLFENSKKSCAWKPAGGLPEGGNDGDILVRKVQKNIAPGTAGHMVPAADSAQTATEIISSIYVNKDALLQLATLALTEEEYEIPALCERVNRCDNGDEDIITDLLTSGWKDASDYGFPGLFIPSGSNFPGLAINANSSELQIFPTLDKWKEQILKPKTVYIIHVNFNFNYDDKDSYAYWFEELPDNIDLIRYYKNVYKNIVSEYVSEQDLICNYGYYVEEYSDYADILNKVFSMNSEFNSTETITTSWVDGLSSGGKAGDILTLQPKVSKAAVIPLSKIDTVYFDTTVSTTTVDDILSNLSFDDTTNSYIICSDYAENNQLVVVNNNDTYMIVSEVDTQISLIYNSNTGWTQLKSVNMNIDEPNDYYGADNFYLKDICYVMYETPELVPTWSNSVGNIKFWTGSQDEYDSIPEAQIDQNTLYIIYDREQPEE